MDSIWVNYYNCELLYLSAVDEDSKPRWSKEDIIRIAFYLHKLGSCNIEYVLPCLYSVVWTGGVALQKISSYSRETKRLCTLFPLPVMPSVFELLQSFFGNECNALSAH